MKKKLKFIYTILLGCAILLMCTGVFVVIPQNNVLAASVSESQSDSEKEQVKNLRYGYNVTAGKALGTNALQKNAAILKDIETSGLYAHIDKTEYTGTDFDATSFVGYSAKEVASKSGSIINGGINAKIAMVAMDITTNFERENSLGTKYEERYEFFYQIIRRKSFIIQDTADLRDYLTDAFKNDLYAINSNNDALTFLNKYGTHLFTGFEYGGMMTITNYQATSSESVSLRDDMGLLSKIGTANNSAGTSFSFSDYFTKDENTATRVSKYKCISYGGDAVTGMTLDQLFTYNPAYLNGNGGYVYDKWVESINNAAKVTIIGTPNGSRAVPLWELLEDGGSSNIIRTYLIRAYAQLCGDKYAQYLKDYPSISRTIGSDGDSTGTYEMSGYSMSFKNNTSYFSDEDNNTGVSNVYRDSIIFMDYYDNIPAGTKNWKIISGSGYAKILDNVSGVFQVNEDTPNNCEFTIGLYSGDVLLYTKIFTVAGFKFSGGDGTENNPYLISSAEDFNSLARETGLWSKHFKLTNSIDFDGVELPVIGEENNPFSGVFEGNHCILANFKVTSSQNNSMALFAYNSGTIKNLFIDYETVGSSALKTDVRVRFAGGLVGYNKGSIINCKLSNITIDIQYDVTESYANNSWDLSIGGLVGYSNIDISSSNKIEKIGLDNILIKGDLNNAARNVKTQVYAAGIVGQVARGSSLKLENSYLKHSPLIGGRAKGKTADVYVGGAISFIGETASLNLEKIVIGSVDSWKALYDGKESFEIAKCSFIVKNINSNVTIDNCYVKKNSSVETGIENDNLIVLDAITYAAANKLSPDIWIEGPDLFPVIKSQYFGANPIYVEPETGVREFYYGEKFSIVGLKVKGRYFDNQDTFDVEHFSYNESQFNNTSLGNYNIVITAIGYTTTYSVRVRQINVVGVEIISLKENYYVGEKPTAEDYQVYYILENGERINPKDEKVDYINYPTENITISAKEYVLGDNRVEVDCGKLNASVIVEAIEKVVEKIEIIQEPENIVYYEGQNFKLDGFVVCATYSDGTKEIIDNSNIEGIGGQGLSLGSNIIMFAYDNYTTCELEITAEAMPVTKYNVVFKDYDGRVISEAIYNEGEMPVVPSDPTRQSDMTYTYTFGGWDSEVTEVDGDKVYKAVYNQYYIEYTIKFVNYDNSEIFTKTYHYGETIADITHPTKPSDNTYTYTFKSWDKTLGVCSGDETFTATYTQTYIDYTVKFVNYDNSEISSQTYHYGDTITVPNNPTYISSEPNIVYQFKSWFPEVETTCKGTVTYKATYTEVRDSYVIIWNVNGQTYSNIIQSGETPVFTGSTYKQADNVYTYTFIGWNKEIVPANSDTTYVALYQANYINYNVIFKDDDGSIISQKYYHYGDAIEYPVMTTKDVGGYRYTFVGWDDINSLVTGNKIITAQYVKTALPESNSNANVGLYITIAVLSAVVLGLGIVCIVIKKNK